MTGRDRNCQNVKGIAVVNTEKPSPNETPSADRGRDTVTDAMDAYLINAVDAVEGWYGPMRENYALCAAYMQGAAVLHAAEIQAEATDRLTAAINALTAPRRGHRTACNKSRPI